MGYSQLRSASAVIDEPTRLLATVMGLPLVDGVFASLVLAGALTTVSGIVEVGLLIFGGSAMIAVVVNEMSGKTLRERIHRIVLVGCGLILGAALEAMLAPTIGDLIALERFRWFASAVILIVAVKIANEDLGAHLPRPALVVGVGLLVSITPGSVQVTVDVAPFLIAKAVMAAIVATAFAGGAAIAGTRLEKRIDLDRFQFGSALALALIPLDLLGIVPGPASLATLILAGGLSYDI